MKNYSISINLKSFKISVEIEKTSVNKCKSEKLLIDSFLAMFSREAEKILSQQPPSASFFSFAQEEILRLKQKKQNSTLQNYTTAINSFSRFLGKNKIALDKILPELMVDYETWLLQSGVCLNTVSNYMRTLRAIYNKAVKKKLVKQCYPFSEVYTKIGETAKRAVTAKDIQNLKKLPIKKKKSLMLARDLFLFSFYSRGMPFVDLVYLKHSQIRNGYLYYKRHKTRQQLQIKLEPCMLDIINRYRQKTDNNYIFPLITATNEDDADKQYRAKECYYNRLLKELAAMLGSGCHLSSYVARHTWASIAYQSNVELETISKALGHTSTRTTLIYIKNIGSTLVDKANSELLKRIIN